MFAAQRVRGPPPTKAFRARIVKRKAHPLMLRQSKWPRRTQYSIFVDGLKLANHTTFIVTVGRARLCPPAPVASDSWRVPLSLLYSMDERSSVARPSCS